MRTQINFPFFPLLAFLLCTVAAPAARAQTTPGPNLYPLQLSGMDPVAYGAAKRKAAALTEASHWTDAEPVLDSLVQAYPYDGDVWRQLGHNRLQLGKNAAAADAFVQADRYGLADRVELNAAEAARAFALAGNSAEAIHWLTLALHGYTYRAPSDLLAEHAFDSLRNLAPFRALTGENAVVPSGSRTAKLQADLDYYLQQYALFRFPKLTPEEIRRVRLAAAALRKRLPSLSDDRVVVELQRLSAIAPGGHNTLAHLGRGIDGAHLHSIPIDLYEFPEGLFVTRAADPRYNRIVGARVIAFGGVQTEEMMRRVAPLIDRDPRADSNLIWHSPQFLAQLPVLHDLGATSSPTSVTLTLDIDGRQEQLSIDGVPDMPWPKLQPSTRTSNPPPLDLSHLADNYWYADLPRDTVYVEFNSVINQPGESLPQFGLRLRKHLSDAQTKRLIVDARFNGGGNTFEYLELLRTLIAFDAQPGHILYYVEGRATFSAAVNFTTELRTLTHAIFVGEPASAPRAAGDPVFITLPNTKIQVRFSTDTWSLYYPDDTRSGIPPDLPVTLTAADYFANRDPVLDTIQAAIAEL